MQRCCQFGQGRSNLVGSDPGRVQQPLIRRFVHLWRVVPDAADSRHRGARRPTDGRVVCDAEVLCCRESPWAHADLRWATVVDGPGHRPAGDDLVVVLLDVVLPRGGRLRGVRDVRREEMVGPERHTRLRGGFRLLGMVLVHHTVHGHRPQRHGGELAAREVVRARPRVPRGLLGPRWRCHVPHPTPALPSAVRATPQSTDCHRRDVRCRVRAQNPHGAQAQGSCSPASG